MAIISLKKIIQAILSSNEQIINQNLSLLDKYFEEKEINLETPDGLIATKKTLIPKTVTLTYPKRNS